MRSVCHVKQIETSFFILNLGYNYLNYIIVKYITQEKQAKFVYFKIRFE